MNFPNMGEGTYSTWITEGISARERGPSGEHTKITGLNVSIPLDGILTQTASNREIFATLGLVLHWGDMTRILMVAHDVCRPKLIRKIELINEIADPRKPYSNVFTPVYSATSREVIILTPYSQDYIPTSELIQGPLPKPYSDHLTTTTSIELRDPNSRTVKLIQQRMACSFTPVGPFTLYISELFDPMDRRHPHNILDTWAPVSFPDLNNAYQ